MPQRVQVHLTAEPREVLHDVVVVVARAHPVVGVLGHVVHRRAGCSLSVTAAPPFSATRLPVDRVARSHALIWALVTDRRMLEFSVARETATFVFHVEPVLK